MDDIKFRYWLISTLRRASYRWEPRYRTLVEARVARGQYKCNICDQIVGRKDINIDHIIPVVGPEGYVDWNTYIKRMFCDRSGFQAICTKCHDIKTATEKTERMKKRRRKKKKR